MKKQDKYIREIADRLPVVYDQAITGFYEDYNEEGEMVKYPHITTHAINHERRIRKAFKSHGMPGVLQYLAWIHKLQLQRNETLQGREGLQHKDKDTVPAPLGAVAEPGTIGDYSPDPVQNEE